LFTRKKNILKKIKLAIVYQVIFHYRIPFYQEIENDESLDSILIYGNGVSDTKLKNANHSLSKTKKVFSLKIPYGSKKENRFFTFFPTLFFRLIYINPSILLVEGSSSIINLMSAIIYKVIFKKKLIFWSLGKVHNKELTSVRKKLDNLIASLEKRADAIFTYSSSGEEYFLNRGIKKNKIFKGINTIDTRKILEMKPPENQIKDERFRILFIGSIIPSKKVKLLIDVFLELEKNIKNVSLDIIGSGSDYFENLKTYYQNSSENLTFHGEITENLNQFYYKSDIFVLPGLGGLAISEAMAYGLPVICSIADGTEKDLIANRKSGIILKEMNFHNLYSELLNLSENPKVLKQMGINSKERIELKFSFENYYNEFKKCVNFLYEN